MINKEEVLRYLSYKKQNIDKNTNAFIEEAIEEIQSLYRRGYAYKVFAIEREGDCIKLKDSSLELRGQAINRHLQKSKKAVIMAATLGLEVDRKIAYYTKTHLSKAIVMDACATALIEAICDEVGEEIARRYREERLYTTQRYSPGYGDFPLAIQRDLLKVLNAYHSIGLTVTDSNILLPRKSVTAVIGLEKQKVHQNKENKCILCNNKDCDYRIGGGQCDKKD